MDHVVRVPGGKGLPLIRPDDVVGGRHHLGEVIDLGGVEIHPSKGDNLGHLLTSLVNRYYPELIYQQYRSRQ